MDPTLQAVQHWADEDVSVSVLRMQEHGLPCLCTMLHVRAVGCRQL